MDERTSRSGRASSIRQTTLWVLLQTLAVVPLAPSVMDAQVVTNITSSGLNTQISQVGNSYNITEGTRPGSGPNLFHSFGDFSVGAGDIGNFLNNTGLPTTNILARVTGGNISNIDGTVQTTGFANANLFLVNPAGVIFGPTTSLAVGGSVSFTNAQYLRLFDGINSANFYANPAHDNLANSVLAVASVVDFGFLSPAAYGFLTAPDPSGTITVQGGALSVPSGQSISLVGANISIQAGTLDDGTIQAATLSAPGGRINLASVASAGEVPYPSLQFDPNVNGGSIALSQGTILDVSGSVNVGSGVIVVRGGQLMIDQSSIIANTVDGNAANPGIDIQVLHDLSLTNGAVISSSTSGTGRGADVAIVAADSVTLSAAFIFAQTSGLGRGGDVHITADSLTIENGSGIFPTTEGGNGVGGDLFLNVGTLSLLGGSQIQSSTSNVGTDLNGDEVVDVPGGSGGNVTIQGISHEPGSAAPNVVVSGFGSKIASSTEGSGDSGRISIRATSLNLGEGSTILSSTGGTGRGGDIVVSVQQEASLSGQATITSSTSVDGAGGTVTIQGLDGSGTKAGSLKLADPGSGIISTASGSGRVGDIEVHAKTVSLMNGAAIEAGSAGDIAKTAGNVTIVADSVGISGGSFIASQVFTADAGQVSITANNQLTLDNGSIVTSTAGPGRAGDVALNVGSISLANGSLINSASIATIGLTRGDGTTEPAGQAGNITISATGAFMSNANTISTSAEGNHGGDISITAQNVQLSNGTKIDASSDAPLEVTKLVVNPLDPDGPRIEEFVGFGDAGNITINSASNIVMQNSSVTTEASAASGGDIEILAPDAVMIKLVDSKVSTSVGGIAKQSDGGNITIDPQFVVLQNSQVIAQANAGAGGAIDIIATSAFIADPASIVNASSTLGISGEINIQSPIQNVGGELTPMPHEFSSAAELLAQQCAARVADGKFSTFVVAGREGLPVEPGGFLASPSWTAEPLGSSLSGQDPHTQFPAVTGLFPKIESSPIQLAMFGNTCR